MTFSTQLSLYNKLDHHQTFVNNRKMDYRSFSFLSMIFVVKVVVEGTAVMNGKAKGSCKEITLTLEELNDSSGRIKIENLLRDQLSIAGNDFSIRTSITVNSFNKPPTFHKTTTVIPEADAPTIPPSESTSSTPPYVPTNARSLKTNAVTSPSEITKSSIRPDTTSSKMDGLNPRMPQSTITYTPSTFSAETPSATSSAPFEISLSTDLGETSPFEAETMSKDQAADTTSATVDLLTSPIPTSYEMTTQNCENFSRCDARNCTEASNGYRYTLLDSPLNWADAIRACEDLGGSLPRHLSDLLDEDNLFDKSFLRLLEEGDRAGYWLPISDKQEEGVWMWHNGEQLSENDSFWYKDQPDNAGIGQNCALLNSGSKYRMDDVPCKMKRGVICEGKLCKTRIRQNNDDEI